MSIAPVQHNRLIELETRLPTLIRLLRECQEWIRREWGYDKPIVKEIDRVLDQINGVGR